MRLALAALARERAAPAGGCRADRMPVGAPPLLAADGRLEPLRLDGTTSVPNRHDIVHPARFDDPAE